MNNLHITLTEFRNESRVLKEAESLANSGIVESIFIAALHADKLQLDQEYTKKILLHRFNLKTRNLGTNFAIQIIKYLELCLRIYFFYKNKKIKIINIHSLSLLPLGVVLKYIYRANLIYDTHELETEKNEETQTRKIISKLLERYLIKSADLTIVVSNSIADWYEYEYKIKRPVVLLNVPKHTSIQSFDHFRNQLSISKDQKILIYQGNLTSARGVSLILNAFKKRSDDRIVIVFMGYGPLENEIIEAASSNKNIFFYPAVKPNVVLEYTASADIGIHLIQNTCLNHYYCMPNKLFEYSMAGLPVIVSNMKDMSEFVKQNNIGMIIDEFTTEAINEAIDNLLTANLEAIRKNAYSTACKNSWEVQELIMFESYAKLKLIH